MILNDSKETPIWQLTVRELEQLIIRSVNKETEQKQDSNQIGKRYVYGISGIQSLFNCGRNKALELKNTVIADSVTQLGRKIIVDADYALELAKEYHEKKGR